MLLLPFLNGGRLVVERGTVQFEQLRLHIQWKLPALIVNPVGALFAGGVGSQRRLQPVELGGFLVQGCLCACELLLQLGLVVPQLFLALQ